MCVCVLDTATGRITRRPSKVCVGVCDGRPSRANGVYAES